MCSFGKKLKQIRLDKNLSLKNLSQLCNVSVSMLSKIEQEEKTPTIRVATQIATALSYSISDLIGDYPTQPAIVIRNGEYKTIIDPISGLKYQQLSPGIASCGLDFFHGKLPSLASSGLIPAHKTGTEEYLIVTKGKLKIILNQKESFELKEGDTIYFKSDVAHEFINTVNQDTHYYVIVNCKSTHLS